MAEKELISHRIRIQGESYPVKLTEEEKIIFETGKAFAVRFSEVHLVRDSKMYTHCKLEWYEEMEF